MLTTIDGVSFDEALENSTTVDVGELAVLVIGKAALLTNKRAAGHLKDLADIEAFEARED